MDVARPATTLLRRLDSAVLGVLYRSARSSTVREVHRLAGTGSYEGVRSTLSRLARAGLLDAEARAAGTFYTLNRHHLAYPAVEGLFTMRTRLVAAIADGIEVWQPSPLHASLFGSVARQDGDLESDIDILLVLDDKTYANNTLWSDAVAELETATRSWTGNPTTVMSVALADVKAMASGRRSKALWKALTTDTVLVTGRPLNELAR